MNDATLTLLSASLLQDGATSALLICGATFCLLGGVGMARMPDLYTRIQAATKAGTLGVALLMLAAIVHFATLDAIVSGSLAIVFLFLTAPVAAHVIARASHRMGVQASRRTVMDQLNDDSPSLSSHDPPQTR